MILKKIILSIAIATITSMLFAQESTNASGGVATGNGTVSYSIGQVFYSTFNSSTGSIIQGAQQPYEISIISSIDKISNINLQCSAFPNPTTNFLILKLENENIKNYAYQLYDINGKMIDNRRINTKETTIEMKLLPQSTYFLNVVTLGNSNESRSDNFETLKSFKIIKK